MKSTSLRSKWKGFLKLGVVSVPVKLYASAESESELAFNQLHSACGSRINHRKWCACCNREIAQTEIIKGYEVEKGKFVHMRDEDFDAVKLESKDILNIRQVVESHEIDALRVSSTDFVGPDGDDAAQTYATIREALAGKVAIASYTTRGREHVVAVRPYQHGLILQTLRRDEEVRHLAQVPEVELADVTPDEDDVTMAKLYMKKKLQQPLDLSQFPDRYTSGLRNVIAARAAGEEVVSTDVVDVAPTPKATLKAQLEAMLADAEAAPQQKAKKATKRLAVPA